jgi:ribosomal protein S18 acetylase RimI-like enzyme
MDGGVEMQIVYRFATSTDCATLASMNQQLIRDEGHRNRMTAVELEERMRAWLASDYRAVIFERDGEPVGYALFRNEPDYVYLRQFYVRQECRRRGIGRAAIEWLAANICESGARIRIEVLTGNPAGIAFWRACGFQDYALTMEWG